MKYLISVLCLLLVTISCSQTKHETAYYKDLKDHRYQMNVTFADKETSILMPNDFKSFTALDFFAIDSTYNIIANFKMTRNETPRKYITSTGDDHLMLKYGEAYFTLQNKEMKLDVYRTEGIGTNDPLNYLFIPFTDSTSGDETYGGGRYLNVHPPINDKIRIDFNRAYNPYCAYNDNYSCVIPPRSNRLPVAIRAGIKTFNRSDYKK